MKSLSKGNKKNKITFLTRIVLKFQDQLNMSYGTDQDIEDYLMKNQIIPWKELLQQFPGIRVTKLFTTLHPDKITEMVDNAKSHDSNYKPPNFLTFFAIDCPENMDTVKMLNALWQQKNIQYAYQESGPARPPTSTPRTPGSGGSQDYLKAAPAGINARYAWRQEGGQGYGTVGFIDIEAGWDLKHVGLPGTISLLSGESVNYFGHGTAVLGIVLAQSNVTGCVGITPKVRANVISQARPSLGTDRPITGTDSKGVYVKNIADAITAATDVLKFGDVLLLESQINIGIGTDSTCFPSEVEEAIFAAIELASASGVIVIEAAGNGDNKVGNNLDTFQDDSSKFLLDRNSPDFKDSGAIMVGSSSSVAPHSRDKSSNFGNRIDCYAWGENIKTIGDASDNHTLTAVTPDFSGTSGASAIIAGAVISIQSMRDALNKPRFSPLEMRQILSDPSNGTVSKSASDKISVMPDLKKIIINVIARP